MRDKFYEEQARGVLGDDGLALAGAAGELTRKLAAGVPVGFSLRIEVDRTGVDRDSVRLVVGARDRGEAEWMLTHDGADSVDLMLLHVNIYA